MEETLTPEDYKWGNGRMKKEKTEETGSPRPSGEEAGLISGNLLEALLETPPSGVLTSKK